MGYEENYTGK